MIFMGGISLLFSIPTLIGEALFLTLKMKDGFVTFLNYKLNGEPSRALTQALVCGIADIITFIFNFATIYCLLKLKQKNKNYFVIRAEKNLLWIITK